jgi:hypothetical protein
MSSVPIRPSPQSPRAPLQFPLVTGSIRRAVLRRFPYSIHFRVRTKKSWSSQSSILVAIQGGGRAAVDSLDARTEDGIQQMVGACAACGRSGEPAAAAWKLVKSASSFPGARPGEAAAPRSGAS